MSLSGQLRAEWALIDEPHKWTKGAGARTIEGLPTSVFLNNAVCFCQDGARWRVDRHKNGMFFHDVNKLAHGVAHLFGFVDAIDLNDHPDTTHDDMRISYETMIYIAEQCE